MNKSTNSKYDWSTPYDEWLIPILNEYRYGGAIKCRSIPSVIQIHIEKELAKDRQQLIQRIKEEVDKLDDVSYYFPKTSVPSHNWLVGQKLKEVRQIIETMEKSDE